MAESNSYEEQRRRQVEENKRKLEELRLHRLSAAVRDAAVKPMPVSSTPPSSQKRRFAVRFLPPSDLLVPQTKELKLRYLRPPPPPTRRSGRVAGLPEQPSYLEGAGQRDYRGVYEAYAVWKGPTDEERAGALAKAEELQRRIHRIRCPAFVKPMTHSLAMNAVQMVL